MEKPLLSICIPTYNRAEYLTKSLESLVVQEEFSQVEVVISDNASTDNTEEVVKTFQQKYANIVYYKNPENIHDKNFPTVLMRAQGLFRKLYTDTILYKPNSIAYLLDVVEYYKDSKPFIFFSQGRPDAKKIGNEEKAEGCTLDELIRSTSHVFTYLFCFGFWDEDCIDLEKEFDQCDTYLWQTYKGLKVASQKEKNIVIIKRKMESRLKVQNKDFTYGLYTVFFQNFPKLLEPYLLNGQISKKTYKAIRKHLLFTLAGGWIGDLNNDKNGNFGIQTDFMQRIMEDYKNEPYFHSYLFWIKWKKFIGKVKTKLTQNAFGKSLINLKRKLKLKLY